MPHKRKLPQAKLIEAIMRAQRKEGSLKAIADEYGIEQSYLRAIIAKYNANGADAFKENDTLRIYPEEIKNAAIQSYLNGEGAYIDIAAKYNLSSKSVLQRWVKVYIENQGEGFKLPEGVRTRKTLPMPKDEQIQIAKECVKNGNNVAETARKYGINYQRVYRWVQKYNGTKKK